MRADVQSLIDSMEGIAYVVAADGTVRMIGTRNWNSFAAENEGARLVDGEDVLGRNLFSIINGDKVRASYRRLFDGILSGDYTKAVFLSRCDSPGVRRSLRISLTPLELDGRTEHVLIQSVPMSEDARPPMDLFDFETLRNDLIRESARPVLRMCSYCQNVLFPLGSEEDEGTWLSAEEYYRCGGTSAVRISHSICDPCWHRAAAALEPASELHA